MAIVTCSTITAMSFIACWQVLAYGCNNNTPTNCNNASTNKVGHCTVVTPNVAFPGGTCQGATNGYQACLTATNYNCIMYVTYSGFACPSAGNQTNVVSHTGVDKSSGSCP